MLIGTLSFAAPFVAAWVVAQFVFGWSLHEAQLAGVALSTTSVAVVYAVMIEGCFSDTAMGKMILAACFITDFGTVFALGTLFAKFNLWLLAFVVVMCVFLWFMPRWTRFIIGKFGATRVSEPEVKFIFFVLFFLGGLASSAKSEAVLPAYLVGLVVAGVFVRDKTLVHRMRSIAFAVFTPFYFIKAGLYVSLAGALDRPVHHCRVFAFEDGDEDCRRFSVGAHALHEAKGGNLHNAADGPGADLWNHIRPLRFAEPHYRSKAIHDSRERCHFERLCPDTHCAKILPTDGRDDA